MSITALNNWASAQSQESNLIGMGLYLSGAGAYLLSSHLGAGSIEVARRVNTTLLALAAIKAATVIYKEGVKNLIYRHIGLAGGLNGSLLLRAYAWNPQKVAEMSIHPQVFIQKTLFSTVAAMFYSIYSRTEWIDVDAIRDFMNSQSPESAFLGFGIELTGVASLMCYCLGDRIQRILPDHFRGRDPVEIASLVSRVLFALAAIRGAMIICEDGIETYMHKHLVIVLCGVGSNFIFTSTYHVYNRVIRNFFTG